MAESFNQLQTLIAGAERVLIAAHKKPDGDTLGASAAFLNYLLNKGKTARAFCADAIPAQFRFLPRSSLFTAEASVWKDEHDVLCVFDAGDLQYAGVADYVEKMNPKPVIVNIDHHFTNTGYGDLNVVLPDASSTAEIVYRFLRHGGLKIDADIATCLLTGILTDTSHFVNPATSAEAVRSASELLLCGARMNEITNAVMKNKSIPALQLWGRALERLREKSDGSAVSTAIFERDLLELGIGEGDAAEGISNFLSAMIDVPIIMVFSEKPGGMVKGSLRSATRDVSEIAKKFGGGGHKKAAGFTLKGGIVEKDGFWQVEPSG